MARPVSETTRPTPPNIAATSAAVVPKPRRCGDRAVPADNGPAANGPADDEPADTEPADDEPGAPAPNAPERRVERGSSGHALGSAGAKGKGRPRLAGRAPAL